MASGPMKNLCTKIAVSSALAQGDTFQIPLIDIQKHTLLFIVVKRYGYMSAAIIDAEDILNSGITNGYKVFSPNGTAEWVRFSITANGLLTVQELSGSPSFFIVYAI